MVELPLFPLQTVLFPGIPLMLHIFEERYKRMVNLCLEGQTPFGVVLIQRGVEALGPLAEPRKVGCTAEITEVKRLEDGKLNITAVGRERFRILTIDRGVRPYLVGTVAYDPLRTDQPEALSGAAEDLRSQITRFVTLLENSGKGHFDIQQLPQDAVGLAYWAAAMLQTPAAKKQGFLEADDAFTLITELSHIYRREVALLKTMLLGKRSQPGAFSQN